MLAATHTELVTPEEEKRRRCSQLFCSLGRYKALDEVTVQTRTLHCNCHQPRNFTSVSEFSNGELGDGS